jgi:hypothetical protein
MASGGVTGLEAFLQQLSNGNIGPEAADEVGHIEGRFPRAAKGLLAVVCSFFTVVSQEKLTLGPIGCQVDAQLLFTWLHLTSHH